MSDLRPRFLPDREASTEWGLKGSTLARLVRAGFKVPPTAAFGQTQIHGWLATLSEHEPTVETWRLWGNPFSSLPLETPPAPAALERLRAQILAAPMPDHFPLAAETLGQMLTGGIRWPLLLRPSGAHPGTTDLVPAVLVHQPTPALLWEALTKLAAETFSTANARRILSLGIDPRQFRFAVLAQPMLDATASGRAYSRDPHVPWNRTLTIERRDAGANRAFYREPDPVPTEIAPFHAELKTYAGLAESTLQAPASVDWLWDREQLWALGAQTIPGPEAALAARADVPYWTRARWIERFSERLSPLGWSFVDHLLGRSLETVRETLGLRPRSQKEWAVQVRGIVYSDPSLVSTQPSAPGIPALARFAWRGMHGRGGELSSAVLRVARLRVLHEKAIVQIDSEWPAHIARFRQAIQALSSEIRETRDAALVASQLQRLAEIGAGMMRFDLSVSWLKHEFSSALAETWKNLDRDEREFPDLVRLTEGNRTLELNQDWAECAAAIAADPEQARFCQLLSEAHTLEAALLAAQALGQTAAERWTRFLERHGHCSPSWDLAVPTWRDDPALLLPLVRAAFDAPATHPLSQPSAGRMPNSPQLKAQRRSELEQALAQREYDEEIDGTLRALSLTETLVRLEEEHRYHVGLLISPMRRLLKTAGEILVRQQSLMDASDVRWLTLDEILKGLEIDAFALRFVAERRSLEWLEAAGRPPAPELPRPVPVPPPFDPGPRRWQGKPMGPGMAVGPIRLADDLKHAAELEPGTILVTRTPNPTLAPLYPMLGGLISENGDALSPGLVSAREYAIPIVTGLRIERSKLRDGSLVRIDGGSGQVQLLFGEET